MRKPKLSAEEQIAHLKVKKGVLFSIDTEEQALSYLNNNNNFFKLTAYRKNYEQNVDGKYVNLEFAYLRDLAIIDMRIRKCLLNMCLDIEHATRVRIVKAIQDNPTEDGYSVVADYYAQNCDHVKASYNSASESPYCKALIDKYRDDMPVWTFVEIQQFGALCSFLKFLGKRFNDKNIINDYYMLQEIRKLRNACAHNNCIINDLTSSDNKHQPNYSIMRALSNIDISDGVRQRKMRKERIRQITTLLYYYKCNVKSPGLQKYHCKELHEAFIRRPNEHKEYYQSAYCIKDFFRYAEIIIDKWFPVEYNDFTEKKA